MDFRSLLEIYWAFFKIGGLTLGGGLAMLPMLETELVEKRKWITSEELLDIYAIGQCTPGIIAVNTATFVGYKRGKIAGGIIGTLGMISPSIVIITIIAAFLQNFIDNVWVAHAMMGVRAVVCGLLSNTVITLGKKSLKNLTAWIIAIVILALALFTPLPTIALVLMAAASGIVIDLIKGKVAKENGDKAGKEMSDKEIADKKNADKGAENV